MKKMRKSITLIYVSNLKGHKTPSDIIHLEDVITRNRSCKIHGQSQDLLYYLTNFFNKRLLLYL